MKATIAAGHVDGGTARPNPSFNLTFSGWLRQPENAG